MATVETGIIVEAGITAEVVKTVETVKTAEVVKTAEAEIAVEERTMRKKSVKKEVRGTEEITAAETKREASNPSKTTEEMKRRAVKTETSKMKDCIWDNTETRARAMMVLAGASPTKAINMGKTKANVKAHQL